MVQRIEQVIQAADAANAEPADQQALMAVEHTAPGQVIAVNIDVREHQVAIAVTNPGDAIASEHLPRLFERFNRVDASRSNSGANHGLGLAIVKAIALMHGGSVFARSQAGANTFGILLPA